MLFDLALSPSDCFKLAAVLVSPVAGAMLGYVLETLGVLRRM
jgi:hypothetical protein